MDKREDGGSGAEASEPLLPRPLPPIHGSGAPEVADLMELKAGPFLLLRWPASSGYLWLRR